MTTYTIIQTTTPGANGVARPVADCDQHGIHTALRRDADGVPVCPLCHDSSVYDRMMTECEDMAEQDAIAEYQAACKPCVRYAPSISGNGAPYWHCQAHSRRLHECNPRLYLAL